MKVTINKNIKIELEIDREEAIQLKDVMTDLLQPKLGFGTMKHTDKQYKMFQKIKDELNKID